MSAVGRVLGIESILLGIVLGIESIPKSWYIHRPGTTTGPQFLDNQAAQIAGQVTGLYAAPDALGSGGSLKKTSEVTG